MIESMVDAERDLDVLFFDGPERRDDEDKPEMEENIVQEEIEWRRRADEIGGGVRVGTADVILRDVGREAAIQRGLLAARVFHDDSILMDSSLLRSVRSRGLAFTRSSPQPTPHESRYREDESDPASSSSSLCVPPDGYISSRKSVLEEIKNGRLMFAPTPSAQIYDPPLPLGRPPNSLPRGYLFCGARFRGVQRSRNHRFDVEVVIQDVDLADARLCGTLHTKGLTAQLQELTTFFQGEIISEKHSFLTNKWDADVEADLNHWQKFTGLKEKYGNAIMSNSFDYSKLLDDSVMYMRWKEHYLVDENSSRDVTGASFAGFYYIAMDELKGEITGFYYHRQSEMYQLLSLKHVDSTVFDGAEFR
ncbi:Glucose-induced degradation protein 4 -like protein [Toxocara canis]|nr:Glucose-induced degradation protein 4 -like protein [Toxocara canis]